jgi:hypothetical protein
VRAATSRALRFFDPVVTGTMLALLIVAGVGATYGVARVHARLEADALRRELCAERLRSLQARNPFVERYLRPADPCLAWALVGATR